LSSYEIKLFQNMVGFSGEFVLISAEFIPDLEFCFSGKTSTKFINNYPVFLSES